MLVDDNRESKDLENRVIFKWQPVTSNSWIPDSRCVVGGYEANGEKLYVGRALFRDEVIPGKVKFSEGVCYFPWGGQEHCITEYQVLQITSEDANLFWTAAAHGIIPSGGVEGGVDINGKNYFIGRARHDGSLVVGKVQPANGGMYIAYAGKEHSYLAYEVLCLKTVQF